MTGTLYDLSTTAADNDDALLAVGLDWREGQTPGSVNNSMRASLAAIRAYLTMALGAASSGGSANAYTYTSPGSFTLASYVIGVRITFVANHSNSGAATLNVDGLGAKAITKNGTTALVTGDIVSGAVYECVYDGTRFILVSEKSAGAYQPLDATLTAIAALATSADQYIYATGSDTFSLATVTSAARAMLADASVPRIGAANAFTAAQSVSVAGTPLTVVNTTDNATNTGLRIESDRATPTAGDVVLARFYLSDSAGNQDEFARIAASADAVTSASEAGSLYFGVINAGSFGYRARLSPTALAPSTSDGIALGSTSLMWSDLFLASGGVVNFNNGDVTITHSANALAFAGASSGYTFDAALSIGIGNVLTCGTIELGAASDTTLARASAGVVAVEGNNLAFENIPASSETTGSLTVASANKAVTCSGGITLDNNVFAARNAILFDPGTSNRTFTRGSGVTMYVNGTDSASATLAANRLGSAYWRSASVVILSGAFS